MYSHLPLIWALLHLLFGDRLLLYCSSTATVFSGSKQTRGRYLYFMYCLVDANWKPMVLRASFSSLPLPPHPNPFLSVSSFLLPPLPLLRENIQEDARGHLQTDIDEEAYKMKRRKYALPWRLCPCLPPPSCVHVYLSLPPLHIILPPYVTPWSHDLACIPFWPASHSNTFSHCIAVIPSYSKFLWVWWWA